MAAAHGLPSAVVYRMPNNKAVAKEIVRIRAPLMGRLIRTPRAGRAGDGGGAGSRGALGHAGGSAFFAAAWTSRSSAGAARRIRRSPGWPGSSTARSSASGWCACPTAASVSCRGAVHSAARRGRAGGRAGGDPDDHRRSGTLGPRAPGPMAMVPSPLAIGARSMCCHHATRSLAIIAASGGGSHLHRYRPQGIVSMRTTLISAALAACLVTPALAQTGSAPAYPPQPYPGYQPPGSPPQGYQPQRYQPQGDQSQGSRPQGYPPQGYQPPSYQPLTSPQSGAPADPKPPAE